MGIMTVINTAIYSKLTTYVAGTAFYATRVYDTLAPQSISAGTAPYVVFQHVAGGDENINASRIVDCEYRVECIGATLADARTGAGHIEDALHNAALTFTGWSQIGVEQGQMFSRLDTVDTRQYHRRGAFYRIRICK